MTGRSAQCIECRCVDERACAGGCSWLFVDRRAGVGVCSGCPKGVEKFKERFRTWINEFSGKNPERIGEAFEVLTGGRLIACATREAPGVLEVRLSEISRDDKPIKYKVRVREEFVLQELVDSVLAKITELNP